MTYWRSLLFVPGNNEKLLEKAHTRGADAIILDLEDSVSNEDLNAARDSAVTNARRLRQKSCDIVVRVNGSGEDLKRDLEAVIGSDVSTIMIPKATDSFRLERVGELISGIERKKNVDLGSTSLIALIESPAGLLEAKQLASVPRVTGLALGTEDFSLELGVKPTPECLDLPCRQLALVASAYRIMSLVMPISIAIMDDEEAIKRAALTAQSYGSTGALCVHPKQVSIVNECFASSKEEQEEAFAIIKAWELSREEGHSVTSLDGKMIDLPVVERAKRILSQSKINRTT